MRLENNSARFQFCVLKNSPPMPIFVTGIVKKVARCIVSLNFLVIEWYLWVHEYHVGFVNINHHII